jgi:hypothetical protein
MKTIFLLCFVLGLTNFISGQTKKFHIYCQVNDGYVDYGNLAGILPDSMKKILVKRPKRLHNEADILFFMELNGWKIFPGGVSVVNANKMNYLLFKEIEISEPEEGLIRERIHQVN